MNCFWARAFEQTSMRFTEQMGIRGASLYNAFGDKRSLYVRSGTSRGRFPAPRDGAAVHRTQNTNANHHAEQRYQSVPHGEDVAGAESGRRAIAQRAVTSNSTTTCIAAKRSYRKVVE